MSTDGMPSRRQGLPRSPQGEASPSPAASEPLVPATVSAQPTSEQSQPSEKPLPPRKTPLPSRRPAVRTSLTVLVVAVLAAAVVLVAQFISGLSAVREFMDRFPGVTALPEGAPVGLPVWLGWQHFFNVFLMVLIIRTGWRVRTEQRPTVFWTPRWRWMGSAKVSLNIWFHQGLDALWVLNGVVFIVLLIVTGQWMRIVPTSWNIFPNALSAAIQYASFNWPTENGWLNYNSLQTLAYFVTVFLAAPLAIVTGVRLSGLWPSGSTRLNRWYPIEVARRIHLPVMIYFVVFIIVHVVLVLTTGALRNLNHMYASQNDVSWWGFGIFMLSLLVICAAWFAARPLVIAPIARVFGKVGR